MKTKSFMTMAVAMLVFAGCSNDENEMDNWNGEIRLTSGIEVQTRATHNLDELLKEGESVHIWVDDAKDLQTTVSKENLYENNVLTVGNGGALSRGNTMYFPQSGNKVNIYALHTNATLNGDAFPGSELTHEVAQDQRSTVIESGKGYQGSDLVFAKSASVERTSNAVSLTFAHLLSKIEVVLVAGDGLQANEIKTVEILNTKLNAKFTPSKTAGFSVTADGTITDQNPITIDNETTGLSEAEGNDEAKKVLNEAIIVPQTLASGTEFIRITTTGGGVLTYTLPAEKEFAEKTKYRYTVTANLTGLTVTSTISAWGKGTEDNGTAVMP